jgi:gas vesicle structural protein
VASQVDTERVSLCEALDRVLNKGAVIAGEAVISVADVDLIHLGLQLLVSSVETLQAAEPHGVDNGGSRG